MSVTISRAGDRGGRRESGNRRPPGGRVRLPGGGGRGRWAGPGGPPGEGRNLEAALLGVAAAVVALAMVLTWLAVARPLPDLMAQLGRHEVINLGTAASEGDLLPALAFLPSAAQRGLVAARIRQRAAQSPLGNVGELGRLRVSAGEVDARRMPELAARLAVAGKESVPLLSPAELRQLKPHLVVRTAGEYRHSYLFAAALLLAGFVAAHGLLRWRRFGGDPYLLPAILLLCGLGFCMMASLRDPLRDLPLHVRFAEGVLAGCGLYVLGALIDIERSALPRRGAWVLGAAAVTSAVLVAFGGGPGASDAKVNLLGFQPVELIKILIALFLAAYFADRWELLREVHERRLPLGRLARWLPMPRLEYVVPPLVAVGLILFFFFLQKDLGPALVLAGLFLILFSVARGRPGMALFGVLLVGLAFVTAYELHYPRTVGQRIGMWISPWDTWFRGGDHLAQAIWSMATGGATGTGLGLGDPGYVPEAHTDMVLSAIGEELGFAGLAIVALLYALIVGRGLRAARRAASPYAFFLALGFTLLLALEAVVIAGGVLGLLPLSGVTSPWLSSGRSAMLGNFLIAGVLAGLSARAAGAVAGGTSKQPAEAVRPFVAGARWAAVGLGAFALLALLRLAEFQLWRADTLLARGALVLQGDGVRRFLYNPRLAAIAATIPRGSIVDRNGLPLATSDPAEIARHRADLAALLGAADVAGLADLTDVNGATAERRTRIYPFGGRTFQLLGDLRNRVNWRAHNTSFVERDSRIRLQGYDDYAGVVQVRQLDSSDAPQVIVDYRDLVPLLRHRYEPDHPAVTTLLGRDRTVRLTIDARLQLAAEDILRKYATQAGFGAAAVVLDAETGDLLAAASYPFPDRLPAEPAAAADARGVLLDRARYGVYPPGSTFKIVTALAALRRDPSLATKTYECKTVPGGREGNWVRGRWVHDDPTVTAPHGVVDLDKGIRHSCNAYFAQLGTFSVGAGPLLETARLFGIAMARPDTAQQLDAALPQASYGQGQVIATPFQMARVAAAVAAGGKMPEGRWIAGGDNPRSGAPVTVLDAAATAVVARAMRGVVTEGTAAAYLSKVSPPIAGKTGTAEVQDKKSHSWFIGYAPYGAAPHHLAVAVIVEHGGYGGRLAAPAVGEIVRRAADLGLLRQNEAAEAESKP